MNSVHQFPILAKRYSEKVSTSQEDFQLSTLKKATTPEIRSSEMDLKDMVFIEHLEIQKPEDPIMVAMTDSADAKGAEEIHETRLQKNWKRVQAALALPAMQHEILFVLFPIIAVATDEPIFTTYSLFEICSWAGSKTVIDAIVINFSKMGQALRLGLLFLYTWMVIGMLFLRDAHVEDMCSNMFQCFISYVDIAVRDSGVQPLLKPAGEVLKYPHNLYDAFKERADDGSESTGVFMFRLAWDVGFQIFFVYILLSIVTGIIIDAFSLLKFERDNEITDLRTICFVCNIRRFRVDQSGIGFDKHIKTEHNPMFYLYFLIHLQNTPEILLTGQERYVANKVFGKDKNKTKKDIGWLPREETFSMRKDDEEALHEEEAHGVRQIMDKVLQIDDKVDQLTHHVSSSLETISKQMQALSQIHSVQPISSTAT